MPAHRALALLVSGLCGVWALELKYNPVNTRASFFYRGETRSDTERDSNLASPFSRPQPHHQRNPLNASLFGHTLAISERARGR